MLWYEYYRSGGKTLQVERDNAKSFRLFTEGALGFGQSKNFWMLPMVWPRSLTRLESNPSGELNSFLCTMV